MQAYFTPWGLTKHYWIVVKLALTILATLVLIGHTKELSAAVNLSTQSMSNRFILVDKPFIVHSVGGLIVLIVISTISVYKPWGKTSFAKSNSTKMTKNELKPIKPWGKYALIAFVILAIIIIIKHLFDGGLNHH